ncbi:MAG: CHASE3 domain-containing protein [Verrucomicrobiales bacterium]
MEDKVIKRIAGLLAGLVALLVCMIVTTQWSLQKLALSADMVNHTHAILAEAEGALSSFNAGEAALRAFMLSGNDRDRTRSRAAYAEMAEHIGLGKALTQAEPAIQAEFEQLEDTLAERVEFARRAVEAKLEGSPDALKQIVAADQQDEIQKVRAKAASIRNMGHATLRVRDRQAFVQAQTNRWILFAGAAVQVLIMLFLVYLVRDDIKARARAAAILKEANEQLSVKVAEKTVELSTANEQLTFETLGQKWANYAMERQLKHNELILNSIDSMVLVISRSLNILQINAAVTVQTAFQATDLVGRPLGMTLRAGSTGSGADSTALTPITAALKEGVELVDSPGLLRKQNDQSVPVSFSVFPLRDGDKVVGAALTVKIIEQSVPHAIRPEELSR